MRGNMMIEPPKVHFNVAWLKKGGEKFEIVINPDLAIAHLEGQQIGIKELLKAEHIYADSHKGLLASEEKMKTIFGTADPLTVAAEILKSGEVQLTAEHRAKVREEKRRLLIEKIHRNAIEPRTGSPHPIRRIELAFEEAKITVDETKTVDAQITDVLKRLQPVLPIRFERAMLRIHLPAQYAQKSYGELKHFGTVKQDDWLPDGSRVCIVELPAGMQNDLIDSLNSRTHGSVTVERVKNDK